MSGATVDLELTIPKRLHRKAAILAEKEGVVFENFMLSILTEQLGVEQENRKLVDEAKDVLNDLKKDEISFQNPEYQLIFDEFAAELEKENIPDEKYFSLHENENISRTTIDLISTPYELSENWKKKHIYVNAEDAKIEVTVTSSLLSFKSKKVDQIMLELQDKIKDASDEDKAIELMEELLKYKAASQEINSQLGRIVTK